MIEYEIKKNIVTTCLIIMFSLGSSHSYSEPVNINISASQDIAAALPGVDQHLAELIKIQCEYQTCESAEDIKYIRGITPELFESIRSELGFEVIHRGMDLDDDC